MRYLAVDIVEGKDLAGVRSESEVRVRVSLGPENVFGSWKSLGRKKDTATAKTSSWSKKMGPNPNWRDKGEATAEIDQDSSAEKYSTSYNIGEGTSERQGQGAGFGTGERLELSLYPAGQSADEEVGYEDALRVGLTVSVVVKAIKHQVMKEVKELGAVVISGGELIAGTGERKAYTIRDSKGDRAGEIVLAVQLISEEPASAGPLSPPVKLEDGKNVQQQPPPVAAADVHVQQPFDPFAPTPEQEAAADSVRQKLAKITCPLCRQVFVDPVILGNCRHAICRRCVWAAVGDGTKKLMECPSCAVSYNLGFGGTKGLTPARHVHADLKEAGFAQNCNKTDPAQQAMPAMPPQMMSPQMMAGSGMAQMSPEQMAYMQQQMAMMSVQQAGAAPASNPFMPSAPPASDVPSPAPPASGDDDGVFARLNANAQQHAQQRALQEQQNRAARGAAGQVIQPEYYNRS